MRNLLILLLAALALASCGDDATEPREVPVLRFSAIPDQDETRLREKFGPIAVYLADKLGVPVAYVHASTYPEAVEQFRNGDVQLAWFGGLTGVQVREAVPGANAIAQGVEDPEYYSYFIAHRDAGLAPGPDFPTGIKGKTFAFGSEQSTSGRLMPEYFIRKNTGQSPAEYLGAITFSGSHDKTCEMVEKGAVEVGAVSYTTYDRRVAEGQTDPAACVKIWKTPVYADYNFTAHPNLETTFGKGFTARVQKALLEMTDEKLLSAFPRKRLIAATNEDFAAIRELAAQLGFLR